MLKEERERQRVEKARVVAKERHERKASADDKLARQATELQAERQHAAEARQAAARALALTSDAVTKERQAALKEAVAEFAPQLASA